MRRPTALERWWPAAVTAGSTEEVNLLNPAAGNYTVVVQGWGVVGSSPFKLHTWLLDSADAGNMTVTAPAAATLGTTGDDRPDASAA